MKEEKDLVICDVCKGECVEGCYSIVDFDGQHTFCSDDCMQSEYDDDRRAELFEEGNAIWVEAIDEDE